MSDEEKVDRVLQAARRVVLERLEGVPVTSPIARAIFGLAIALVETDLLFDRTASGAEEASPGPFCSPAEAEAREHGVASPDDL